MSVYQLDEIKDYIFNLHIEILDLSDMNFRICGSIEGVTQDGLVIFIHSKHIQEDIYLNKKYTFKIIRETSLFSFEGSIFSIQNQIAYVKILSPITKIQNRKYFRLKILGTCQIHLSNLATPKEAIFYNISEGGLAIVTSQVLFKHDKIFVDIPSLSINSLEGTVLKEMSSPFFEIIPVDSILQFINNVNPIKNKSLNEIINIYNQTYSIKFEHKTKKTSDVIRKFIFHTQLNSNKESSQMITY